MAQTTETAIETPLVNVRQKQPSERLQQAISNCSLGFKKLADAIHEALEIGASEGYSPKEIGSMVRLELSNNGFSDSTIRRYLPKEAKMQSKVRDKNNFAIKMSANPLQPQDYDTDRLESYSKQFLIAIIRMYEEQTKRERRPTTNNKTQEIITLHNQGKSVREIARLANTSASSVMRVLHHK